MLKRAIVRAFIVVRTLAAGQEGRGLVNAFRTERAHWTR